MGVALLIVAVCAGVAFLLAMILAVRKLFGPGATTAEVEELIERTVANELAEIKALLEALDHKVYGHGEQIAFLDGRLQGGAWERHERRQPRSRRRPPQ